MTENRQLKIQAVFFDFDGTLFDTRRDILAAYMKTFREMAIPIQEENFRIGPPLAECVREAKPDVSDAELVEIMARFRANYDEGGYPATVPYPGAAEMLDRLHAHGIPCFVATNKRGKPLRAILAKNGWSQRFTGLFHADMETPGLSKIALLERGVRDYDLDPARCVMVGDTRGDIIAGRAAGMYTVAAEWGYAEPGELAACAPDAVIAAPEAFTLPCV